MSNDNEVSCPKCGSENHKGIYFRTCLDCGTYYNKDGSRIGSDGVTDSKGNLICPNCRRNNIKTGDSLYFCPDCGTMYTKIWQEIVPGKQKKQQAQKPARVLFSTALGLSAFAVFFVTMIVNFSRIGMSGAENSGAIMAVSFGCIILSICLSLPKLKHALLAVSIMIAVIALIFGAAYLNLKNSPEKYKQAKHESKNTDSVSRSTVIAEAKKALRVGGVAGKVPADKIEKIIRSMRVEHCIILRDKAIVHATCYADGIASSFIYATANFSHPGSSYLNNKA